MPSINNCSKCKSPAIIESYLQVDPDGDSMRYVYVTCPRCKNSGPCGDHWSIRATKEDLIADAIEKWNCKNE